MVWEASQANSWTFGGNEALQEATKYIIGSRWTLEDASFCNKNVMAWVRRIPFSH